MSFEMLSDLVDGLQAKLHREASWDFAVSQAGQDRYFGRRDRAEGSIAVSGTGDPEPVDRRGWDERVEIVAQMRVEETLKEIMTRLSEIVARALEHFSLRHQVATDDCVLQIEYRDMSQTHRLSAVAELEVFFREELLTLYTLGCTASWDIEGIRLLLRLPIYSRRLVLILELGKTDRWGTGRVFTDPATGKQTSSNPSGPGYSRQVGRRYITIGFAVGADQI